MAKYSQNIHYGIGTSLDKTGLTQLQTEIQKTINELNKLSNKDLISDTKYKEARSKLQSFQEILGKSFNSNLNMMDFGTLNKELKSANLTVKDIQTSFSRAGAEGNTAFTKVLGNFGKIDTGTKQISRTTDKIFNTIGNTVRWGIVSAGFNGITTALSQSVQYIKELDTSLTNIRVVSDYTTDQMRDFSIYANESAKALGQTTVAFTDATEIFAAQGYTLEDSERLAEMTLKVANTTGQATGEVSEQLTAWINGYQMTIDQAEKTMDKVTAIAAWGAADTEELMTAASKVASVASTLGVTEDQLISQMSTIISVTREAPETVGNALKTLYARIGDLKMGETLEDGLDLGDVSSQLEAVGVQILDVNGDMRNMGDILEDLMARWDDFSAGQKQAIAVTVAGKQQYARFMSLMENDEMYNTTLDQSMNQSAGYLDKAQSIYMDSLEASLKSLEAAKEGIMTTLFNGQDMKPFIDALTTALDLTNEIVKSFGGLDTIILGISSIALKEFSSNIGNAIGNMVSNRHSDATVKNNLTEQKNYVRSLNLELDKDILNNAEKRLVEAMDNAAQYYDQFDEETRDKYKNALASLTESIVKAKTTVDESNQDIQDVNTIHEIAGTGMKIKRGENGALDISDFKDASLDTEFGTSLKQDLLNQKENIDEAMANSIKLKELLSSDKVLDLESILKNTEAGSDERLQRMAEAADRVGNKIANNTQDLTTDLLFAMEKLGASSEDIDKVMNASTGLTDTLEKLYNQEDLNEDQTNELISAQKALEDIIDEVIKKYQTASDIVNDSEENDKSREKRLLNGNQGETVAIAENAALNENPIQEFKFKNLNELIDEAEFKNAISNVVQLTGALGQLAFGMQAISNLPSIWSNQDLSMGDKILQTVTNLTTALPSLYFAIETIRKAKIAESLSTISDKLLQVNATTKLGSIGLKAMSGAFNGLSAAISTCAGPLMAIFVAFQALSAINNAIVESEKEVANSMAETAESAKQTSDSVNASYDNFNTLYQSFKDTGEATDELIDSAKELSETLGIQGAEAQIAAGNFDTLAESIQKAKDAENQKAISAAQNSMAASSEVLNGGLLGWDSLKSNLGNLAVNSANLVYSGNLKDINESNAKMADALNAAIKSDNIDTQINGLIKFNNDITASIDNINEKLKNVSLSDEDKAELERNKEELLKLQNDSQALLARKDVANYISQREYAAKATTQLSDFQKQVSEQSNNYQGIIDTYLNNDATKLFLDSFTTWEEKLQWMIQNTTDETAKLTLMLEQAKQQAEENVKQDYYEQFSKLKPSEQAGLFGDRSRYSSEEEFYSAYAKEATKYSIDTISNDSILTTQEKIELIGELNEGATLLDIQNSIEDIQNSGSLPKLAFQTELTDRSDFSDKQLENISKEANISQAAMARMSSDLFNDLDNGLGQSSQAIKQEIEAQQELRRSLQETGQSTDEVDGKIGELRQAYQRLGDTAEDITAYNIQMNKGIENLIKNWDSFKEVIGDGTDDAINKTADYYEVIGQLDEIMSDILNLDVGTLSNDFYQNANALAAMESAANGNKEALEELRYLAAEDIIMHMDIQLGTDGTGNIEQLRAELLNSLNTLQAEIPNLEIGTDLQDSDLVTKLNEMLAKCQITAEQASAILSSFGVDATIETKDVKQHNKVTQYFPKFRLETESVTIAGNEDMSGAAGSTTTVSIPKIVPDGVTPVEYWDDSVIQVPEIKGANYTGKGIQTIGNNSAGRTSGGKNAPRGGGGGGGGRSKSPKSSSGSGSNKAYEPKSKDPIEEEYDRYKKVDHQLEKNGNQLKTLTTHQERLVQGSNEWLKSTEKRVELINKEIGLNKEKLSIAEQEQKELKDYLAGQGVQFDAEGFFLNGKEIQDKLVKSVNDAINKYNSSTTEADQDHWEKVIKEREEALKTYQKNLDRYAEVHGSLIPELIDQLEELEDQIEDIRIGIVKNGLEAVNTLKDMTEKANEFNAVFAGIGKKNNPFRALSVDAKNLEGYLKADKKAMDLFYQSMNQKANDKNLSDAIRNAYKEGIARSKQAEADGRIQAGDSGYLGLMQQYTDVALEQLQQLNDTGTSSIFGKNSEEAYKFAQDVANQAMEMLIQSEEAFEQMHKDILDAIDYMAEYTKDRLALYDDLTKQMEYIADLSTIMYGTSDLTLNNALLEKRTDILKQQNNEIRASRAEYQNLLDVQNKELAALKASGASRQEIEYAMERQKALQEQVNKLTQQERDNVLAIAKIREEIRQNSINQNFKNMDMKFLGNDLDWIKTEWDLINADATEYLDAVNSAYEIQKLQGKYTELLNGSNDLLIQQKITAQMNEQLGFLREQENLSAHDVAYANAKLEALQKQIALEEAQRNKSQMKLRRDSQGNYSYVYTANQDDIADKEAAALDAQNNLYNMEKNYMLEQGQNYLSTYEKFKNAMNEVANNTEISAEERAKRMAALQKAMEKQLNQIVEETTKTQGRLTEEFLNLVDMLTEENKSDLQDTYDAIKEGSFDAFDQVDNRIVDSFHLIVDNADKTQQYIGETVDGIKEAWYEFSESIKEVSSEASTDIENVGNEINKVNDALGSLSSTQQEFINQLKTDAKDVEKYMGTLDDYREKIWNLEKGMSDYKAKVDELNKQNQALQQEKAQMSVQIANLQQSSSSGSGAGGSSGSNGGSGGNSGGFGGTQYSKGQLTEGIAGNIWSYGTWGTDPTRSQRIKQKFGNQAGQEIINGIQKLFNGQPAYGYNYAPDKWKTDGMGYYKKFSYSSFDTGGYTGTWNAADSLPNSNAGRLAVLHQKELVLNAQDTENILRAVYAVRDLTEGLKVNQLDNIMSFTSQMPDITMDNEKEIKQDVHITADFPNVHDGREIEQALLSLNEQAVQYAFKSH